MNNLNPLLENPLIALVVLSAGFAFIFDFAYRAIRHAVEKGKPLVVILPGTPGALASVRRRKLKKGQFSIKSGDEREVFVAAGMAAYPSNLGPLHILTDFGANLVAPSKDYVAKDIAENGLDGTRGSQVIKGLTDAARKAAERFLVWDPLILFRACKENDTEDYYAAQQGKPHWMEKVAPFLMIAVLALVGLVGFMLYKIMPMIQGASG